MSVLVMVSLVIVTYYGNMVTSVFEESLCDAECTRGVCLRCGGCCGGCCDVVLPCACASGTHTHTAAERRVDECIRESIDPEGDAEFRSLEMAYSSLSGQPIYDGIWVAIACVKSDMEDKGSVCDGRVAQCSMWSHVSA